MVNGVRFPIGLTRVTDTFNLSKRGIQKIIHAVGPDGRIIKSATEQRDLLESACRTNLECATKYNYKGISFPFISSGIYHIGHQLAAQAALDVVNAFLKETKHLFRRLDLHSIPGMTITSSSA